MFVASWLLLEGTSLLAHRAINRSWFSYSKARNALNAPTSSSEFAVAGLADLKSGDFVEVLHPYFGFVADPQQNKPYWQVSDFGFPLSDRPSPIVKRSPGKVVIGVFGGSFTHSVYLELKGLLNARSTELGQEFVVINFALGGYKQPQQLMALNYLLALGAEFDVVINLDGFNEVALPPADNIPRQVNPFYPRGWDRRTANAVTPGMLRVLGYREVTKLQRSKWTNAFAQHHLYLSPTLFLIWQFQDQRMARTIYKADRQIASTGTEGPTYTMRGPAYVYADDELLYRDIGDVWERSSLQMKVLCEANGAKYYHFLQPNQYLPGSKPMMEEERRQAINEASPYRNGAMKGYPVLVKRGQSLLDAGMNFTDLTMVFADHAEILYKDDCCHTNTEGSIIVAKRIYDVIFPR
jgi:hypothetical protein